MTRYLISFDEGAMDHLAEEDWPEVGRASQEVTQDAKEAGVFVADGGFLPQRASVVAPDGLVTDGPYPETKEVVGGFLIVEVPTREDALAWAARNAAACRTAMDVREIMPDS